ncbi:MAG: hypothetical protein EBX41_10620, partial [Chitinophagia bacterium]|nr:hypothetical protein [Chitinophagia bacterium]
ANDSKHYVLAFLSRSYHESIKSKGASALVYFHVEKNGKLAKEPTPATPMVFYSRPKGDYLGNDTANVLLDFYVWNTTLQAGECAVKATIENTTRSAIMDTVLRKWQPTIIHNLGSGKCKVTLNLIDKDGKAMEGTQTKVSREFNLVAQEPVAH